MAKTFEEPAPDPPWDDRDAVVEYLVEGERPYAGTLGFDAERVRTKATAVVARTVDMAASVANHWLADEDPADRFCMSDISVPTLVLHGTADPMFPTRARRGTRRGDPRRTAGAVGRHGP